MEEIDRKDWYKFKNTKSNKLNNDEVELISRLHAKYFFHKYHKPCSCSPKKILRWIDDLNDIYD